MEIGSALAALSASIGLVKDIKDAAFSLDSAQLKAQMAELYSSLADARMQPANINHVLRQKDEEIERLRASHALKKQLIRHRGEYYEKDAEGCPVGAPFCEYCYNRGILARKIEAARPKEGLRVYCPECQNEFRHLKAYLWPEERKTR